MPHTFEQGAGGGAAPAGTLHATRTRDLGILGGTPVSFANWRWKIKHFVQHGWRSAHLPVINYVARTLGLVGIQSELRAVVFKADGRIVDYGVLSRRVVTTAGVGFIVDAFQNLKELENFKFHGVGTGATAEASSDTALVTESTTAINPDSTRATGSTTEGASANIYRTVGTVTFDNTAAITEHGVFDQAATGGGVLLDRSVFSAINVANGDSIQFTYDLTFSAGG